MKALSSCARWIDWLSEKVGFGVSWLTAVLMLVVCFDVTTRYVFDFSLVAVQEIQWHLFALIFLFGAAWTLKDDKHVRVDLVYAKVSPKTQAWINLLGALLFVIPFCVVVIWVSIGPVELSWMDGEGSPNPGGLPGRYLLKTCIPIAFVLLALQGVSMAMRSLLKLLGKEGS